MITVFSTIMYFHSSLLSLNTTTEPSPVICKLYVIIVLQITDPIIPYRNAYSVQRLTWLHRSQLRNRRYCIGFLPLPLNVPWPSGCFFGGINIRPFSHLLEKP